MKTLLVDAFNTSVIKDEGVNHAMLELLETYANPKLVLTNATQEQMVAMGIDQLPYEIFTMSHEPEKIEPLFYATMLKKFNLSVNDVVYFEHNADAVKSARSVGINTYHYDKDAKDLVALKQFLDTNI